MKLLCILVSTVVLAPASAGAQTTSIRECEPAPGQDPHADPVLASPTEPADAVAHLKAGKAALRAQDFDEAIDHFKEGVKSSDAPIFLYALGQGFRLAGRFEESIRAYELFLDRAQPGEALRAVVECLVDNMRAELERRAMTMPPTDMPPDVPAGSRQPAARHPSWYEDPSGFALVGGGVLVGAVGGLLLVNASSLDDQAANEDREPVRDELREKADSRRMWGGVVTAVGAVALVSGVVKLVITPDAPRGDRDAEVALLAAPDTIGLGLVGRF